MPDLLIAFCDDQSCFQLEHYVKEKKFRVRSSADLRVLEKWLKLWRFDGMLIDASFSLEQQLRLAEELWQKNLLAPFICYNLNSQGKLEAERSRLFGAEAAVGERCWKVIDDALEGIEPRHFRRNQDYNILVVEDLDSPRDIICMYIESFGFPTVVGAGGVAEALQRLRQDPGRFSCVITDIKMPKQGGIELIEILRSDPQLELMPIIVLTAYGTLDILMDALKAGASGFLVKPPRKRDLLCEISRALRLLNRKQSSRLVAAEDLGQIKQLLIDRGWG